jgi:hypothetical protein
MLAETCESCLDVPLMKKPGGEMTVCVGCNKIQEHGDGKEEKGGRDEGVHGKNLEKEEDVDWDEILESAPKRRQYIPFETNEQQNHHQESQAKKKGSNGDEDSPMHGEEQSIYEVNHSSLLSALSDMGKLLENARRDKDAERVGVVAESIRKIADALSSLQKWNKIH